jgi:glycosyltransferase involved in cell wall biosynthesis
VNDQTVTVITLTRMRPDLLFRAMASVSKQDAPAAIEHLILIDDCAETAARLGAADLPAVTKWELIRRKAPEIPTAARLAALRNYGVRSSASDWICFLDDDNEFAPNHISALLERAEATGCRAIHSWMKIFHSDGRPFLERLYPWSLDVEGGRDTYRKLVALGIMEPGSNVARDRSYPEEVEGFAGSIDTSEWLFSRNLLLEVPFPEMYSDEDCAVLKTEDDKLLEALLALEEPIACSEKATLHYYLGGYSNVLG